MSVRSVAAVASVRAAGVAVEPVCPPDPIHPLWFSAFSGEHLRARRSPVVGRVCEGEEFRVCVVFGALRDRDLVRSLAPEPSGHWRWYPERDGASALRRLVLEPVDLLVSGLSLPDWDGHDLAAAARRLGVARQVVLCADRIAERDLELLHVRRGPDGWTAGVHLDDDSPTVLAETMRSAAAGAVRVSEALRAAWRRRVLSPDSYVRRLTPAQTRLLAFAGSGLDDQSIAEELALSVHTVRVHRKAVMRKLDLHSQSAVVAYAVRRGLVRFVEERVLRPGFDVERLIAATDAKRGPASGGTRGARSAARSPSSAGAGTGARPGAAPVVYPKTPARAHAAR